MKIARNRQVESAIIRKIKAKMDDPTRGIDGQWHASDLYSCFRQKIKEKVDGAPEHDRATLVRFMFGFAVEDYIFDGDEEKRQEYLGVLFTVDGMAGDDILEMKTTAEYMAKFDEAHLGEKLHWTERTKAYCAVRGKKRAHVSVFFIHQRDFLAFTIDFTDEELAEAEADIPRLRDTLEGYKRAYVESGTLPPVETRKQEWECGYCPWRKILHCDDDAKAIGMKMPDPKKWKHIGSDYDIA
jgi:hypothetical protein